MATDLLRDVGYGRRVSRPTLRISYDADLDFLWALAPGEVVDGHLEDETEPFAADVDAATGLLEDRAWWYRRGPRGPLIGLGVAEAFKWDVASVEDDGVWDGPRFDVPTLALRDASAGEVILAAQRMIDGSTPDVLYFDMAIVAGSKSDWQTAEDLWRCCLEAGEMKAHYGLGYTLVELGRPRDAFGHLAMYTEICPRNAWAWYWRGLAAIEMDEHREARHCFEMALFCEELGSNRTDAAERLTELGVTE